MTAVDVTQVVGAHPRECQCKVHAETEEMVRSTSNIWQEEGLKRVKALMKKSKMNCEHALMSGLSLLLPGLLMEGSNNVKIEALLCGAVLCVGERRCATCVVGGGSGSNFVENLVRVMKDEKKNKAVQEAASMALGSFSQHVGSGCPTADHWFREVVHHESMAELVGELMSKHGESEVVQKEGGRILSMFRKDSLIKATGEGAVVEVTKERVKKFD